MALVSQGSEGFAEIKWKHNRGKEKMGAKRRETDIVSSQQLLFPSFLRWILRRCQQKVFLKKGRGLCKKLFGRKLFFLPSPLSENSQIHGLTLISPFGNPN
jgi:hypothetical protein